MVNSQVLVDAGADLLAKDALGLTPLDLADKADHTETMAVLRGAVDRQEQEKQRDFYSLLDACARGDLAAVRAILGAETHPSELVNYVPNGSSSLLFKASEHGQKDVVKYLLEAGARAVIHPVTKYSPLYIAAYNGKKDIVEVVLKKYPELINVQTVEKWLPLHAACFNGHASVLEFLLKYKFPPEVVMEFKDRTGSWKYFLPFDINQRDLSGQSILYLACCIGNLRMVDLLLEYKVKAVSTVLPQPSEEELAEQQSTPKRVGLSALISKFSTREEVLRSNEAWVKPVDLDLYCNHESETALHVAVRSRHHAIASHLLAAGALPNLHTQGLGGQGEANAAWGKGHTCLVEAAKNRDMGMIDLLLKYGARDDQNQSLVVASQASDHLVMSKLLALKAHQDQEAGVNKNAIAEMHLGKSIKSRSSVSNLTYSSMCPSTPVMINWHQTGSLTQLKEQWLVDAAVRLNPKLRLSPKYQPMALHAITRLDISNNEIVSLPASVTTMQSLKFLSVAGNKLEALPETPYSCPWLEELHLQDNRLDSLPAALLRLPSLSILDASNNKLQAMPFAMWSCTSLRELNLSLNMLSDLPTSSHLSRHESVSSLAGENHIFDTASISSGSDVGRDVDNLSTFSETDLEGELEGDAKQLEEKVSQLDQSPVVHCNKWKTTVTIVEKEQLDPSVHQDDCKLMTLNLSHNSFREVPACLSCLAPHLARLHLSYNQLASVGPLARFPASMKHLDLAHNQIASWPVDPETDVQCYGAEEVLAKLSQGSACGTPEPRKLGRVSAMRQSSRSLCHHRRHGRLDNLRTLILADNLLRDISLHVSLPDNASSVSEDDAVESNPKSRLMFGSLSMLDMSNNSIRSIPTYINELNNLSVFNISGNSYITDLPPEMGLLNRLWNLNTR